MANTKKENDNVFNADWYQMWMEQSKEFYTSAEKNLKDLFNQKSTPDPQDHIKQIQAWLDALKSQWNVMNMSSEHQSNEKYWKAMAALSAEASELMMKKWIQRTQEGKPIHDVRELYELWLTCCQEVYAKAIRTPNYQEMYGEFMNAVMNFWKVKS